MSDDEPLLPVVNGLGVGGSCDEIVEEIQVLCAFYRKDRGCLLASLGHEFVSRL